MKYKHKIIKNKTSLSETKLDALSERLGRLVAILCDEFGYQYIFEKEQKE